MLYRKAYKKLLDWKSQKNKKALCITGARQIGKTTLIRVFGKENYERDKGNIPRRYFRSSGYLHLHY